MNVPRDQDAGSVGDQVEVMEFLMNPQVHAGSEPVQRIDTHAAHVFLCGQSALKIKRPVTYDYLDFSSLDRRREMLTRELELNHPTAPRIYKDVVPIVRQPDNSLALGGSGEPVEWVLRMWRFPSDAEFAAIVERGELTDALAERLGFAIADYHRSSESRYNNGSVLIRDILEELRTAFATMLPELERDRVETYLAKCDTHFEAVAELLAQRSGSGHVRRAHGDLHLGNIVLIDGKPVPFDALEFDKILGICDVLYDLAFLVMDLQHRTLRRAANIVLNGYLYASRGTEDAGLAAFPLFLAVRAGIRAMVDVQTDRACGTPGRLKIDARRFLEDSNAALSRPPARLIAVGGRSGSGKTSLARSLSALFGASPGAVHIRSDLERKAIFCVDPLTHLPPDSYSTTVNRQVHERLRMRAETILASGHSVLLDAVYLTPSERAVLAELARRLGVPFDGVWLETDPERLIHRVAARLEDASDANETVVRQQLRSDAGTIEWTRIDASGSRENTFKAAREALGLRPGLPV
jgi:uncharacterized protein